MYLSTGVEVFSMKLIIFSFTFTDLDLRAKVILFTRDLTPLPSPALPKDSPWRSVERERERKREREKRRDEHKMDNRHQPQCPRQKQGREIQQEVNQSTTVMWSNREEGQFVWSGCGQGVREGDGRLTSAELRLLWEPDVLTIQWTYELSSPSTFMSARCCWRAADTRGETRVKPRPTSSEGRQSTLRLHKLTHEAAFRDADVLLVFLRTHNNPKSPPRVSVGQRRELAHIAAVAMGAFLPPFSKNAIVGVSPAGSGPAPCSCTCPPPPSRCP